MVDALGPATGDAEGARCGALVRWSMRWAGPGAFSRGARGDTPRKKTAARGDTPR